MDSSQQRGNLLGQYRLGARYRNTSSLGRVYRALHVETGAPALVLQRTERQADDTPLADWKVRVTSSVSPAFLAIEVVSAPVGGDPLDVAGELIFMLQDAANTADATLSRPETMPHLLAAPRPPAQGRPAHARSSRSWRRPALVSGLAALAATALLALAGPSRPSHGPVDVGAEVASAEDAGWGGSGQATAHVLASISDTEPFVLARALPRRPFDTQKLPPCDKQVEVEINGGCWVPHETRAPCPDRLYEYAGKCYLPSAKAPRAPTAMFR